MYYTTLLVSSIATISLVAAAEPNCLVGFSKTSIETFTTSFNSFCKNQSPTAVIGVVTFTFEGTGCEQATCVENFNKFSLRCGSNGNSITGRGDIATDSGCGKYSFQIGGTTNPAFPRSVFGNSTTFNTTNPQSPPTNSTTIASIPLPTATPKPADVSSPSPPTATKPTASPLPTGGASLAKVSGGLIVGVASIFIMFL